MNYSLIIPIYNEEKTLDKLLIQLQTLSKNIEVIIINDGSTDKTKSILDNQNYFKIIHNSKNLGKGSSIIIGSKYVESDNIILMDGDLEINMNCIPQIIKAYESKTDCIIVGSRWNKKSRPGKNINTYGNFLINYIFNILYKTVLSDVLCCVKALNRNLFKSLKLESNNFSIEIEMMSKLALGKNQFYEIDVVYNRRKTNEGKKLKMIDSVNIIWTMLKLKF